MTEPNDRGNGQGRGDGEPSEERRLLDVTSAAEELAQSLNRLDDEWSSYRDARQELREAGGELTNLAEAVKDTGEKTQEAIEVLQDAGIPEVLGALDETRRFQGQQMEVLGRRLDDIDVKLTSATEQREKLRDEGRDQLSQLSEELDRVRNGAAERHGEVKRRFELVEAQIGGIGGSVGRVIYLNVATIVAIVAVAVVVFLR